MKNFLYLIIILLSACSHNTDQVEIDIIELFPQKESRIPVITDSILSEFSLMKLETPDGIFLGGIDKLIFTKTRIYISDFKIMNAVFIFDSFGNYIHHITGGDKGPGEFVRPQSITADFDNDRLFVFDDKLKKIIQYDPNGGFVNEVKFKYTSNDISLLSSGVFAFNSGYPQIDNKTNSFDLLYVTESGKVSKKHLPLKDWRIGSIFNKNNAFTEYMDTTWYCPVYNDTIYRLTPSGPLPTYHINMGKDFVTGDLARKIDLDDPRMEYNHAISEFLKCDDVIYISYGSREKRTGRRVSKHAFIDLNSKNTKTGEYISGFGISTGLFRSPIATTGDYFVSSIDAFEAKRALEWKINNGVQLPEERMDLYYKLSESDNPILMFYRVSPF